MSEPKDINEALDRLARENAELRGLVLATGVILTQLLQSMTLRELNPQAGATRIVTNARRPSRGSSRQDRAARSGDEDSARSRR